MPDPPEGDKSKQPGKPRRETLEKYGIEPELPETTASYLADYLFEVGPGMPGFAGLEPISAQELRAWQEGTGITLAPWEFRFLCTLSRSYIYESRAATKRGHPAPWRPEEYNVADELDTSSRLEEAMDRDMDL